MAQLTLSPHDVLIWLFYLLLAMNECSCTASAAKYSLLKEAWPFLSFCTVSYKMEIKSKQTPQQPPRKRIIDANEQQSQDGLSMYFSDKGQSWRGEDILLKKSVRFSLINSNCSICKSKYQGIRNQNIQCVLSHARNKWGFSMILFFVICLLLIEVVWGAHWWELCMLGMGELCF